MIKKLKKIIFYLFSKLICTCIRIFPFWLFGDEIINSLKEKVISVGHKKIKIKFCCPSRISHYRAQSFSIKEPGTLLWIEGMSKESIFWDIGANVGLYSIYAAKKIGAKVISFEPSVFNLELLVRNINLNGLNHLVAVIPIPLSNFCKIDELSFSSKAMAAAQNTFGESFGQDGRELKTTLSFRTIGMTIDQMVENMRLEPPTHVKLDVDGIEHLILKGGENALKCTKSVLVEVNDEFNAQAEGVAGILKGLGFKMKSKTLLDQSFSNQIWERSEGGSTSVV